MITRYTSGPLRGATVDLPDSVDPGPLAGTAIVTAAGILFDRRAGRPVKGARVVELPEAQRAIPEPRKPRRSQAKKTVE